MVGCAPTARGLPSDGGAVAAAKDGGGGKDGAGKVSKATRKREREETERKIREAELAR